MQKKHIIIIAGVIAGIIAVVLVAMQMQEIKRSEEVKRKKELAKARQNQVSVLVARQDISAGTTLQPTMFESAIVPRDYVQPQAASTLDRVAGMVAVAPIAAGEQISLTKLTTPTNTDMERMSKPKDLASLTPVGKRAVPVVPENISDIMNLLKPGDYIDVIAVLPIPVQGKDPAAKQTTQQTILPVFQNVLVLAVGEETSPSRAQSQQKPGSAKKAQMITLALSPKEASIITFLQEQGKIRISMRSTDDTQIEPMQPITWENILEFLPGGEKDKEAPETIEIYRGMSKEKIPVSK